MQHRKNRRSYNVVSVQRYLLAVEELRPSIACALRRKSIWRQDCLHHTVDEAPFMASIDLKIVLIFIWLRLKALHMPLMHKRKCNLPVRNSSTAAMDTSEQTRDDQPFKCCRTKTT